MYPVQSKIFFLLKKLNPKIITKRLLSLNKYFANRYMQADDRNGWKLLMDAKTTSKE